MAITITKEPSGIYPAYNPAYIEFSSDLADNNRANITILPISIFPNSFVIYPDLDGVYLFDLNEAVKAIFDTSNFSDNNVFTNAYYKSIAGLYKSLSIRITAKSDVSSFYIEKTYEFCKCAKQVGESVHSNEFQLLSHSADGVNYALTYFEGFPFAFDILKAVSGEEIKIKSLNTGDELSGAIPTTNDSFRFNIDKSGGNNWTSDNILPLITGLNKLEIYSNDVFKTNLLITKKKQCSGIYLKWFNNDGGYNYYLFDRYFMEGIKTSEIGMVLNNDFLNVGATTGSYKSMGKDSYSNIDVRATFTETEYETLRSLFESPSVQMYTSQTANVEGYFIDVMIDGDFPYSNKKAFNKMAFTIIPPKRVTPIL